MSIKLKPLMLDILAIGLIVGSIEQPKELKIAAGLGAMGLSYIAHEDDRVKTLEARRVKRQDAFNGLMSFHQFVTPASVPMTEQAKLSSAPLTELSVNAAKHPHVMIIGRTGSGKSTIAEGLAAMSTGKRFAIAPHLDPAKIEDEWKSCHGVFCGGRNYGSEDDEPVSYDDLTHNRVQNVTAFQVLQALHGEMDRRYRDPAGFESHEQHDWFLDETPAIARSLDKWFGKLLAPQAYEARKVGLRLWIITQNDNVRAMKIEGEGRVRDNFTYLYLGEQAKKRLRYCVTKGMLPEIALEASYNRLAMVDETPCEVPDKIILEARIDANMPSNRFAQFYSGDIEIPDAPKPVPKSWEEFKEDADIYDELMVYGLDNGKSKRVIVESLWGFKGKNYSMGCEFYDRLIPETLEA